MDPGRGPARMVRSARPPRRGLPAAQGAGRPRGVRPGRGRGRLRPARRPGGRPGRRPAPLRAIPAVRILRTAWARHYERAGHRVLWEADTELPRAAEGLESPYDTEAGYRTKGDTHWAGYMVHLTETRDEDEVHLISR